MLKLLADRSVFAFGYAVTRWGQLAYLVGSFWCVGWSVSDQSFTNLSFILFFLSIVKTYISTEYILLVVALEIVPMYSSSDLYRTCCVSGCPVATAIAFLKRTDD